ncbi:hypothetical protein BDR22DRAFT_895497 [Usnea florida]
MLPAQLAIFRAAAVSALSLQLVQPNLLTDSNSIPDIAVSNRRQGAVDASFPSNLSSTLPQQWNGIIALPINESNARLLSPSSNDRANVWNDTYVSALNVSTGGPGLILPDFPKGWKYGCDQTLGTGLNSLSCFEAWGFIPLAKRDISFGPRGPASTYDVKLPKRYLSSDGTCFIEPALLNKASGAYVQADDIGSVVAQIIRKCVGRPLAVGGIATNLGGGNNFAVRVSKFVPKVVCSPRPYPSDISVRYACGAIVDSMEASTQNRLFAQHDIHEPGVEESLPASYISPDKGNPKCILRVSGTRPRDIATWYQIWEAATAIDAMCVRKGKGGYWADLGFSESLVVEMGKAGHPSASVDQ